MIWSTITRSVLVEIMYFLFLFLNPYTFCKFAELITKVNIFDEVVALEESLRVVPVRSLGFRGHV